MGTENGPEFNSALNVEGEPRSTEIKFYYDEKTEIVERIVLDSDGVDIPLYPIHLEESGLDYIPPFDVDTLGKASLGYNNIHLLYDSSKSSYSVCIEDLEKYLYWTTYLDRHYKNIPNFLQQNLSQETYARFIIEQTAVASMYHSIFGGDQRRILFQWPSFYPEKKESKLEYLPCSEEIYTTYLLDDLVFICNNSDKIKSTTKYFNQEEITHLVKFFRDMYNFTFIPPQPKLTEESLESTPERKSFELGRKLLEHYNFNTDKMIEHLEHYVFLWDRRLEKEEYLDNINELLENWWKIDLETKN